MENQHKLIKGYRDLTLEEIALMNEIKETGVKLGELCKRVEDHLRAQYTTLLEDGIEEDIDRNLDAEPFNWAAFGKHDLQVGIMKLVRSVAQPTTF